MKEGNREEGLGQTGRPLARVFVIKEKRSKKAAEKEGRIALVGCCLFLTQTRSWHVCTVTLTISGEKECAMMQAREGTITEAATSEHGGGELFSGVGTVHLS